MFSRIRLAWPRRHRSSFLVLLSLCCMSVSTGGGGPLQRLGVDTSSTPGRGTLGPTPGRGFQREEGLTQTSVSFLLGMKSESKPAGRDLTVSAFFHSGTPTVKLLRFFFFNYFIIIILVISLLFLLELKGSWCWERLRAGEEGDRG